MRFVFVCATTLATLLFVAARRRPNLVRRFRSLTDKKRRRPAGRRRIMDGPVDAVRESNGETVVVDVDVDDQMQLLDTVSFSSQLIAAYRALESKRSDGLFFDPLAERFAGPKALQQAMARGSEALARFAVRTRWVDDALRNAIKRTMDEQPITTVTSMEAKPSLFPVDPRTPRNGLMVSPAMSSEKVSTSLMTTENDVQSSIELWDTEEAGDEGEVEEEEEEEEALHKEKGAADDKASKESGKGERSVIMPSISSEDGDGAGNGDETTDGRGTVRINKVRELDRASSFEGGKNGINIETSRSLSVDHHIFRQSNGNLFDQYGPLQRSFSTGTEARRPTRPECQVVILGAGMDARAWRLLGEATSENSAMASVIFEVDRHDVIGVKEHTLVKAAAQGKLPLLQLAVKRIPVAADLESDNWYTALRSAGFSLSKPTVWLMEGLLMYLKKEGVLVLLNIITMASCRGSAIVATGVSEESVRAGRSSSSSLRREWRWGCDDPEDFFSTLGWKIADVSDPYSSGLQWGRPVSRKSNQGVNGAAESGKPRGTWYIYAML